MPRFVLLYHDCPPSYTRPSHWDLMLETGDMLRTWALEKLPRDWKAAHLRTSQSHSTCPSLAEGNQVSAEQLADHRREYLEFDGELTNHRGSVIRVAAGAYEVIAESSNLIEIATSEDGSKLLLRLTSSSADDTNWHLILRTMP